MSEILHPYFRLSGEFDPDDISKILGIQPSYVQRIGDPGPPDAIGPRLGAEWYWQPEDDDSNDVGDQLAFMAGALSTEREKVAELSKKFDGGFHVYHLTEAKHDWFVSAKTLRLIADLNVDIVCENVCLAQVEELKKNAN